MEPTRQQAIKPQQTASGATKKTGIKPVFYEQKH